MRLNKDNYELILFDLLEGQIPEHEVKGLMDQIESDPFYREEWALMQQTVLSPDLSVVFEQKDKLFKREPRIFPLGGWYTIGIAASIALLAAFYFGFDRQSMTDPFGTMAIQDANPTNPTGPIEQPDAALQIIGEVPVQPDRKTKIAQHPLQGGRSAEAGVFASTQGVQEDPFNALQEEQFAHMESRGEGDIHFAFASSTNAPISSLNVDYLVFEPVTFTAYDRMIGKVARTVTDLSNPTLDVQPNWQERRLDISLETKGYSAIASITPFNR